MLTYDRRRKTVVDRAEVFVAIARVHRTGLVSVGRLRPLPFSAVVLAETIRPVVAPLYGAACTVATTLLARHIGRQGQVVAIAILVS